MHPFTTRLKSAVRSFVATASFLPVLTTAAVAEVEVTAIDFGQNPAASCGVGPVYSGEFDGTGGFVSMAISDCGVVESPTLDLGGGVTFQFTNVSGWNNTDGVGADQVQALTGDHFLTSALGADDPASVSVTSRSSRLRHSSVRFTATALARARTPALPAPLPQRKQTRRHVLPCSAAAIAATPMGPKPL